MDFLTSAILIASVFITATVSGVFGMAGGLMMKGVLVSLLTVAASMVMHGFVQIVSNLSRAALLWRHISWKITGRYAVGVLLGVAMLLLINWRPGQTMVFFLLGLTAMVVLVPKDVVAVTIERPLQAEFCGFWVQLFNTLAGVAGPLLDIFFVKTELSRQTVVATKSATQVMAHAVKIAFWGAPLVDAVLLRGRPGDAGLPPLWVFGVVVPASLIGTWLGGRVLDRMTDVGFRAWTKWIVAGTGVLYLMRGLWAVAFPGSVH
jgi:uncharacterized membrane protein YfcA